MGCNRLAVGIGLIISIVLAVDGYSQGRRPPAIDFEKFRHELTDKETGAEKLRQYAGMSMRSARRYPDSLFHFAQEVQQLSNVDKEEKAGFRNFILAHAWRSQNRDSAIYYAKRSVDKLKSAEAYQEYLQIATMLGIEYTVRQDFVKAEEVYLNALEVFENGAPKPFGVSKLYGNLGILYTNVGLYNQAIEMFERFLEDNDNPGNRCNILSKLAESLMSIGELEHAYQQLLPCRDYEKLPPPIQSIVRTKLAVILERLDRQDEALQLREEATAISSKYRIPNLEVVHPVQLGLSYLESGQLEKADSMRTIIQSFPDRKMRRPAYKVDQLFFLANFYLSAGQPAKVMKYADEAIRLAGQSDIHFMLKDIYTTKAQAHEQLGEMNAAVESLRKQRELEKLQQDRRKQKDLAMMNVRYQLRHKEDQLQEMTSQLGTVQVRTVILILLIILIGLYVLYRYRMFYLLKEERTRTKIAGDLHDEVSASLSSISYFAEAITQQDPSQKKNRFVNLIAESASEAKDKITDIIWAINPEQDSWQGLLAKVQRYASDLLESKAIDYQIDIEDNITGKPALEVKQHFWLIFKEILTNAARHSEATRVVLVVRQQSGQIQMLVRDDGQGFDPSQKHKGYGIRNIHRRADIIDAEVEMSSKSGEGTRWQVLVPLS